MFKLLSLPFRSIIKLGEKIQEEVEQEFYDIKYIQQQLIELHLMYELEEIDEEAYVLREQELLTRYKIAKEREKSELLDE
ncbi:gas vesicle protein GvpG [Neobacillus bataviensis]|uniref:gas vesicle protein GvpG n=1 Tax=Neobacillus bataviensis TaxID=220685 RepID=UPI001CBFFB73|nr:gas vesicle protein GvpG [Neobacillus bataviensis]